MVGGGGARVECVGRQLVSLLGCGRVSSLSVWRKGLLVQFVGLWGGTLVVGTLVRGFGVEIGQLAEEWNALVGGVPFHYRKASLSFILETVLF